jgi:hypothetical protein
MSHFSILSRIKRGHVTFLNYHDPDDAERHARKVMDPISLDEFSVWAVDNVVGFLRGGGEVSYRDFISMPCKPPFEHVWMEWTAVDDSRLGCGIIFNETNQWFELHPFWSNSEVSPAPVYVGEYWTVTFTDDGCIDDDKLSFERVRGDYSQDPDFEVLMRDALIVPFAAFLFSHCKNVSL